MIVAAIVRFICSIVTWFLGQLPAANLSALANYVSAAAGVVGVLRAIDRYVPMSEALFAFTAYMGVYGAIHGFNGMRRAFSLFWPGAGG